MLDICACSALALSRLDWQIEELSGELTGYWPSGILAPVHEEARQDKRRAVIKKRLPPVGM